jgi:hypothetical protein
MLIVAVLALLMLATKVWEDEPVWNTDFINLFPTLSSDNFKQMERRVLNLLHFDCTLTASQYASIYFDLRAGSKSIEEHFKDLKPLDKDGQVRLEERSLAYTKTVAKKSSIELRKMRQISQSDTSFKVVKSPQVILN